MVIRYAQYKIKINKPLLRLSVTTRLITGPETKIIFAEMYKLTISIPFQFQEKEAKPIFLSKRENSWKAESIFILICMQCWLGDKLCKCKKTRNVEKKTHPSFLFSLVLRKSCHFYNSIKNQNVIKAIQFVINFSYWKKTTTQR